MASLRTWAWVLSVTIGATAAAAPQAPAAESLLKVYTAAERDAIRHMPIENRPNRVGHFYGNTVRRLNKLGR